MAKRKVPMAPISYKRGGKEYGNAAAAAAICGNISAETFQWYVRTSDPESANPAPRPAMVDNDTRQSMYLLKQVRAWHAARPGRGNWGGIGARARKPKDEQGGEVVETPTPKTGVAPAADPVETEVYAETFEGVDITTDPDELAERAEAADEEIAAHRAQA